MKKFEWVDHPSDIGFRAYGRKLEEAFENAALALTEIMVNAERIVAKGEISIKLEAEDLEALLFDWLGNLLYLFDSEGLVASEFDVEEISKRNDEFGLKAKVRGEKFDSERHESRTEVKAVTYHMMEIEREEGRCSVQVIVDI